MWDRYYLVVSRMDYGKIDMKKRKEIKEKEQIKNDERKGTYVSYMKKILEDTIISL